MKRIIIPLLIAAFLWFFMFSPWTSGIFNFWTTMSFSAVILMNMSFALRPQWWVEDVKFDWKNISGGVALCPPAGRTYLWYEDRGKSLATLYTATHIDRPCRRNLLAWLCTECTIKTLELEYRFHCDDAGLCLGAHLVV